MNLLITFIQSNTITEDSSTNAADGMRHYRGDVF
jgi:hypothetical protein